MGISWELHGSSLGFTGLAEKRKKQGWLHPECIPNASRMFFFALQIIFLGVMLEHSRKKIVFLQSKT